MKKETRERVQTTKYDVFVAMDGKEFCDETQCKQWEYNLECTINAAWNKIPKTEISFEELFWGGCCEEFLVIIKPRNMEDIKIINMKCQLSGNECVTQDDIGKEVAFTDYSGEYYRSSYQNPFETLIKDVKTQMKRAKSDLENYGSYEVTVSCGTFTETVKEYSLYDCMTTVKNKVRGFLCSFDGLQKLDATVNVVKDGEEYKKEKYSVEYDKEIGYNSFKFELVK